MVFGYREMQHPADKNEKASCILNFCLDLIWLTLIRRGKYGGMTLLNLLFSLFDRFPCLLLYSIYRNFYLKVTLSEK